MLEIEKGEKGGKDAKRWTREYVRNFEEVTANFRLQCVAVFESDAYFVAEEERRTGIC